MFHNRTPLQKLLLLKAFSGGGQSLVERTATGNPLTFGTDVSKPLKSLLIPFTPVQSGTGDPSPQNIRSILPWNGLKVWHGGGNVLDEVVKRAKNMSANNGVYTNTEADTKGYADISIEAYKGTTYLGQFSYASAPSVGVKTFVINTANYPTMDRLAITHNGSSKDIEIDFAWGLPVGIYTLQFELTGTNVRTVGGYSFKNVMVEVGSSATTYEPYKPITETDISFPSPVYGGTLDVVSGVLTVEWISVHASSLPWVYSSSYALFSANTANTDYIKKAGYTNILSNKYKTVSDALSSFSDNAIRGHATTNQIYIKDDSFDGDASAFAESGFQVVYELDEPFEITLTPEQITDLKGDNTIWSDADGSMTAVYLVSSKYAEEHPVGGLGSGLGSGLLGSGTGDDPENHDEPTEPDEPIEETVESGQEEGDTE